MISGSHHCNEQCLDTGEDFPFLPDGDDPLIPHAFAATLLRFLDSLTDPVVPPSLHPSCTQMTSRDEAFEVCCLFLFSFTQRKEPIFFPQLLDAFPPPSVNVNIIPLAFGLGCLLQVHRFGYL